MTHDPYFFGYGSLVNRATHAYPDAQRATLSGWRRAWVRSPGRTTVFLTGVPAPGHRISGLIARVPDADWDTLDLRETGYARVPTQDAVTHDTGRALDIAVYAVQPHNMLPEGDHVILMSYLDVVVQGFLREFGADGVAQFFATTDNWDTPILDDRDAPLYPRHQVLHPDEHALVDQHLKALSAHVQHREQAAFSAKV